jgi:hypothetical protein
VGPQPPTGRESRAAWRALSLVGRQAAWSAAKAGASPGDLGIGLAAAGHGRRMVRAMRALLAVVPAAFLILIVLLGAVAVEYRGIAGAYLVLLPALLVGYLVGMLLIRQRIRRYRALYDSGMLAIEAAQAGAVAPVPDPAAWRQSSYQSEFTVPYQAPIRTTGPVPRPPADPARAGTQRIGLRRGPVALRLAVPVVLGLVLWLAAATVADGSAVATVLRGVLVAIAAGYTVLVLISLLLNARFLVEPTVARFDPAGWALPSARMGGTWEQVREIRVRAVSSRSGVAMNPVRAVVLIVDDPQAQLDGLPPLRRMLARRALRRYGSPATIVASHRTLPAADLIALLQRYTDAPVRWG